MPEAETAAATNDEEEVEQIPREQRAGNTLFSRTSTAHHNPSSPERKRARSPARASSDVDLG